jgi:SIR2-like domain
MSADYDAILNRLDARQAILFLGAGSTIACTKTDGTPGLSGFGLAQSILQELTGGKGASIPKSFEPTLMEAAEYFQANHPGRRSSLDEFLQRRLRGLRPTLGHYLATSFPWKAIITTNYNSVAEDTWAEANNHGFAANEVVVIRTDEDIALHAGETSKIRLYKPHGCVNHQGNPQHRMVLTSQDYFLSKDIRKGMYDAIRALVRSNTTVFVGYSLADYTFRNMYYQLFMDLGDWAHGCYSIAPVSPPQLLVWKSKAMASLNTVLLDTSFDAFMVRLALARGTLRQQLKDRISASWTDIHSRNRKWMKGVSLNQILALR